MYEIIFQTDTWQRGSHFFNDKDAALKVAKEMVEKRNIGKLDWLTLYSGHFGNDHRYHARDVIYDFYMNGNKPEIYEQK